MRKYLLIIILFTTGFVYSQYQEATLYFKDGTSWEGLGEILTNDLRANYKIEFRFNEKSESDVWDYLMVKGITFHGFEKDIKYEYVNTSSTNFNPLLMEILAEGEVTLYADVFSTKIFIPMVGPSMVSISSIKLPKTTRIFVKRDDEEYPTRLKGRLKKSVIAYFGDCAGLIEGIHSHEFRRTTVAQMVDYYNNFCAD